MKIKFYNIVKEINKSFLIGILSLIPISVGLWVFSFFYSYFKFFISFLYKVNNNIILSFLLFLLVFSIVSLIGFKIRKLERIFFLSSLENFLSKLPLIGFIISTVQELIKMFYNNDEKKYLGVVKVPFNNGKTLGLITATDNISKEYTVFIPTAPNPTSGFVMYYHYEDLEFLDINIQDVFKIQLSLGVNYPTLKGEA